MSEAPEGQQTDPATHAPFRMSCTGCGADIDAPDRYFTLGPMALVPHANHALITVRCLTCETDHELAVWTMDQQRFISELGPEVFHPEDPQVAELVEHYEQLVRQHRREVDAQYGQQEGWPSLDLSDLDVEIRPDRCFARPMAMLAVARGARQAVADRPGAQPPSVVLLGQYRCVLSFDETPQAPYPYALHLSVGNTVVPGHLPPYALHWLASLFFTPGEVPLLLAQPGQTVPVIHYYLPAYEPDLNPC